MQIEAARKVWKDDTPSVVQDRILRGAALLDTYYVAIGEHAWPEKINLDTLDLQSQVLCVCGQLEGRYTLALVRYGLASTSEEDAAQEYSPEARDHGFVRSVDAAGDDGTDHSHRQLTVAWRAYLTLRLNGEL